MTNVDRKELTEWMGEYENCFCNCNDNSLPHSHNRTFTTWQDFVDLANILAERGEWKEWKKFERGTLHGHDDCREYRYMSWILNPEKTCQLVLEYIRSKKVLQGG